MPVKITTKQILKDAIKGTSPYYSVFDHPLIKKAGSYIGGFKDEWHWDNLDSFTEEELKMIYLTCKNSWNGH